MRGRERRRIQPLDDRSGSKSLPRDFEQISSAANWRKSRIQMSVLEHRGFNATDPTHKTLSSERVKGRGCRIRVTPLGFNAEPFTAIAVPWLSGTAGGCLWVGMI